MHRCSDIPRHNEYAGNSCLADVRERPRIAARSSAPWTFTRSSVSISQRSYRRFTADVCSSAPFIELWLFFLVAEDSAGISLACSVFRTKIRKFSLAQDLRLIFVSLSFGVRHGQAQQAGPSRPFRVQSCATDNKFGLRAEISQGSANPASPRPASAELRAPEPRALPLHLGHHHPAS